MIHLLRHSQQVQREEDGAVHFWRIKENLQSQFPQSIPNWPDDRWKACLAAGGGAKRKFQYCTDDSGIIVYLRALQGHSGRNLIDPSLQDNLVIQSGFFQHIYHIGCAWPGGWCPQGKRTTGGGGLARVPNLRECKHLSDGVAHVGGEGWINILPWYRLVGVAIPPVSREGVRTGLPKKGKWSPRGTGTTVLTYPCPIASRVSVAVRGRARGTGKASENGQNFR